MQDNDIQNNDTQKAVRRLGDEALLNKLKVLVQEERKLTLSILHHLREVERRRLFATMAYPSLFEYAVRELGYSPSAAQRRISAMRLLRELPDMEAKIQEGKLSLSVVAQAQSFFHQEAKTAQALVSEEKREVLKALEGKTSREAERELIQRSSQPIQLMKPEKVRQVTEEHSELRLVVDQKLLEQMEKLRGLLAHSHPGMSMRDLIDYAVQFTLQNVDPAREVRERRDRRPAAERATGQEVEQETKQKVEQGALLPASVVKPSAVTPPEVAAPTVTAPAVKTEAHQVQRSRYIPLAIRREVWRRDGGCCSNIDPKTGRRCEGRYGLELDHLIPFAAGGANTAENLRLVCRKCNQRAAIESYGMIKMGRHLKY